MQNTYNTASAENIPSSSSFRTLLQRGRQLLVAALAAVLAASLMAVVLLTEREKFRPAANREQCLMAQRGTIRLWFKWDR